MGSFTFKTLSALLSIPFMYAYYLTFQYAHLYYFGTPYPLNWLVYAYLAAIFMHMSCVTDEDGEVKLCGKRTGIIVEHGWFLLANFFHFTVSFFNGFAIVFGIRIPSEEQAQQSGRSNVEIYLNQLFNRYNVNMTVGPITGAIMRIFDNVIVWTFRKPHLIPMRFGFLLMVLIFSVSMIHNGALYMEAKATQAMKGLTGTPSSTHSSAPDIPLVPDMNSLPKKTLAWWSQLWERHSNVSTKEPEEADDAQTDGFVTVKVQLSAGTPPVMPEAEWFIPDSEENTWYYKVIEGDGRKYYLYPKVSPDTVPLFTVKESFCILVPPGRQIAFVSKSAPTNAVNMKDSVLYRKKEEYLTIMEKFVRWKEDFPVHKGFVAMRTWQFLRDHWYEVNTKNNHILSEALPSKALKKNASGGIVCF